MDDKEGGQTTADPPAVGQTTDAPDANKQMESDESKKQGEKGELDTNSQERKTEEEGDKTVKADAATTETKEGELTLEDVKSSEEPAAVGATGPEGVGDAQTDNGAEAEPAAKVDPIPQAQSKVTKSEETKAETKAETKVETKAETKAEETKTEETKASKVENADANAGNATEAGDPAVEGGPSQQTPSVEETKTEGTKGEETKAEETTSKQTDGKDGETPALAEQKASEGMTGESLPTNPGGVVATEGETQGEEGAKDESKAEAEKVSEGETTDLKSAGNAEQEAEANTKGGESEIEASGAKEGNADVERKKSQEEKPVEGPDEEGQTELPKGPTGEVSIEDDSKAPNYNNGRTHKELEASLDELAGVHSAAAVVQTGNSGADLEAEARNDLRKMKIDNYKSNLDLNTDYNMNVENLDDEVDKLFHNDFSPGKFPDRRSKLDRDHEMLEADLTEQLEKEIMQLDQRLCNIHQGSERKKQLASPVKRTSGKPKRREKPVQRERSERKTKRREKKQSQESIRLSRMRKKAQSQPASKNIGARFASHSSKSVTKKKKKKRRPKSLDSMMLPRLDPNIPYNPHSYPSNSSSMHPNGMSNAMPGMNMQHMQHMQQMPPMANIYNGNNRRQKPQKRQPNRQAGRKGKASSQNPAMNPYAMQMQQMQQMQMQYMMMQQQQQQQIAQQMRRRAEQVGAMQRGQHQARQHRQQNVLNSIDRSQTKSLKRIQGQFRSQHAPQKKNRQQYVPQGMPMMVPNSMYPMIPGGQYPPMMPQPDHTGNAGGRRKNRKSPKVKKQMHSRTGPSHQQFPPNMYPMAGMGGYPIHTSPNPYVPGGW